VIRADRTAELDPRVAARLQLPIVASA